MQLSPDKLAYCTNVHAGADLATTRGNLQRYAVAVRQRITPDRPMGIGLWLSAKAARELLTGPELDAFAGWLREVGLIPFTFNGFPYGDFHQPVVKHRVYEPTWSQSDRFDYTCNLARIQHALLPPGISGSISTLPIAWGQPEPGGKALEAAAGYLAATAEFLERHEQATGRFTCLCLEPEPGCVLQRSADVVSFFQQYLFGQNDEARVRRHIRVCHDVCHAAVMFESQEDVLKAYHDAGIGVGKVQVSAAIRVPWDEMAPADRPAAVAQLAAFAEDRYLHQTVSRDASGRTVFHEDLPVALRGVGDARQLTGEWRIHFHVPIYLERFGLLSTSRDDILACLSAARKYSDVRHFEVETYAWGVLPPELREADLAAGIAREIEWFRETAQAL